MGKHIYLKELARRSLQPLLLLYTFDLLTFNQSL